MIDSLETALVPFQNPALKRVIELSGPVDFLFIGAGTRSYRQSLIEYMSGIGLEVGIVGEVTSDLYASGQEGKLGEGLYGIAVGGSSSTHQFTAEPDNGHALVIVSNAIRFGRQFREICEVLEYHLGRNMGYNAKPPTFAFFKKVRDEDGGVMHLNVFTPVGKGFGFNYLSPEIAPYIS